MVHLPYLILVGLFPSREDNGEHMGSIVGGGGGMAVHQESTKGEGALIFRSEADWKAKGKEQKKRSNKRKLCKKSGWGGGGGGKGWQLSW